MRIIAGEFRGRQILSPESEASRPITDRVKQSVFDILTPLLEGAIVFDCFAGTGSMGFECLSRGADRCVFFEQDRSALTLLRKNIQTLGVQTRAEIVAGDLFKWFAQIPWSGKTRSVDSAASLIFLDPPYRFLNEQPELLRELAQNWKRGFLSPAATIVFRHDAKDSLDLPGLAKYDERKYGAMAVEFLRDAPAN